MLVENDVVDLDGIARSNTHRIKLLMYWREEKIFSDKILRLGNMKNINA